MTNSATLPAPFQGMNTNTSIAALSSPYCQNLFNFNTTDAGISLRKGNSLWSYAHNTAPTAEDGFLAFVRYGDIRLFYTTEGDVGNNRYFDITTSTPTLAYTSLTGITGEIFTVYFNQYLYTFGTGGAGTAGDYYNGSAWGSWGWTLPGSFVPIGGCGFKNRIYLVGKESTKYAYGGVSAITGTLTAVDLGSLILEQSYLSTIAPVTVVTNGAKILLLAFVFFSGEVLFYGGSYPDGADWSLISRGRIGKPLNYNCAIDYQGDALILTRIGLTSLRDVFLGGQQEATTKVLSEAISPTWTALVNAIIESFPGTYYNTTIGSISYVRGVWQSAANKIVISFPVYDVDDLQIGNTIFVYDTLRNAWSVHHSESESAGGARLNDIKVFRDELYMNGYGVGDATNYLCILKKEGASDYQDEYDNASQFNYGFDCLTAPLPFTKTASFEATTIEPIIESDLYNQTTWNFVADFGRQSSGNGVLSDPSLASTVSKPAVDIGIQNATFVQVKISGDTMADKTVGLKLYSYNVWVNYGKAGSR